MTRSAAVAAALELLKPHEEVVHLRSQGNRLLLDLLSLQHLVVYLSLTAGEVVGVQGVDDVDDELFVAVVQDVVWEVFLQIVIRLDLRD